MAQIATSTDRAHVIRRLDKVQELIYWRVSDFFKDTLSRPKGGNRKAGALLLQRGVTVPATDMAECCSLHCIVTDPQTACEQLKLPTATKQQHLVIVCE